MGQRLNIEIKRNGKVQANCYYHWRGYTPSAAGQALDIIRDLDKVKEENPVVEAIRLLEGTGAGIYKDDLEEVKKQFGDDFREAKNRNDGIISITPENMKETRSWEEARITLDLDRQIVKFNVWCKETPEEFIEWHDDSSLPEEITKSPLVMTFEEFEEFCDDEEILTTKDFIYKNKVYSPIY